MDSQSITLHIPGEPGAINFWVWLRGQGMNPADDDDIRLLAPWLRERCASFSRARQALGDGLMLHQDVTAAALAAEEAIDLPVLREHVESGALFVGDLDGNRLLAPTEAGRLFVEALRWCDADYHDLMPEFADLVEQHLAARHP